MIAGLWAARLPIAQSVAREIFVRNGFENSRFQITTLTIDELVIEDISIDDVIRADRILLFYNLPDLWRGKIGRALVEGGYLDISTPDQGVLQQIKNISASAGPAQTAMDIPEITFRNATLVVNQATRSMTAHVTGTLSRNMKLRAKARMDGRLSTEKSPLFFKNATLDITGDLAEMSGQVVLQGMDIGQEGVATDFAPLRLRGTAILDAGRLTADAVITTLADVELLQLSGTYDISSRTGQGAYVIDNFRVSPDGLQPLHLLPSLNTLPLVSAWVNGTGTLAISEGGVNASGNFDIRDFETERENKVFKATRLQLVFDGQGQQSGQIDKFSATLSAPSLDLTASGKTYRLADLLLNAKNEGTDKLRLTLGAEAMQQGAHPDFLPFKLMGRAVASRSEVTFDMAVSGVEGRLDLRAAGLHSFNGSGGQVKVSLRPLQIGKKAVPLKKVSPLLAKFSGKLQGILSAAATLEWDDKLRPTTSLEVRIRKAGFQNGDLSVQNMDALIKAASVSPAQPFKVTVSRMNGMIAAAGRSIEMKDGRLSGTVAGNWRDADFTLRKMTLIPKQGLVFKLPFTVTASGSLKQNRITVTGNGSTDLLGRFVTFEGGYDLQTSSGSATVTGVEIPFAEDGLLLGDLITAPPENLVLNGAVKGRLSLRFDKGKMSGNAVVSLLDLSVKQDGFAVTGLVGDIEIDRLSPIQVTSVQQVTADSITAGIAIDRPVLRFRLMDKSGVPILYIDRLVFELLGGAAEIRDGVIDTGATSNRLVVSLSSLSLSELLALGELGDVSATGQMKGRIPLVFDGDKLTIELGVLESEGPGELNIKSEQARQALSAGGAQTKLLFDILENFKYSQLSLKIKKPASGEDVVTLKTKGSNPAVENNRAVILNVNLSTNLDRIFKTLLDGYRLSEKALRATVRGRKK